MGSYKPWDFMVQPCYLDSWHWCQYESYETVGGWKVYSLYFLGFWFRVTVYPKDSKE